MLQEALSQPLPTLAAPPQLMTQPSVAANSARGTATPSGLAAPVVPTLRLATSPAPVHQVPTSSRIATQPAVHAPASSRMLMQPQEATEPFDTAVTHMVPPSMAPSSSSVTAGTARSSRATGGVTSFITYGIPLGMLSVLYLGVAALVASISIASRDFVLQGVVLASPLLSLGLVLHSMALSCPLPVIGLSGCCALALPTVLWVSRPLVLWALCLALSLFFTTSMPRCLLRGAAVSGTAVVLASLPLFFVPFAPQPVIWGVVLATLSIQSVVSTGRFRGQRLLFSVCDDCFS